METEGALLPVAGCKSDWGTGPVAARGRLWRQGNGWKKAADWETSGEEVGVPGRPRLTYPHLKDLLPHCSHLCLVL